MRNGGIHGNAQKVQSKRKGVTHRPVHGYCSSLQRNSPSPNPAHSHDSSIWCQRGAEPGLGQSSEKSRPLQAKGPTLHRAQQEWRYHPFMPLLLSPCDLPFPCKKAPGASFQQCHKQITTQPASSSASEPTALLEMSTNLSRGKTAPRAGYSSSQQMVSKGQQHGSFRESSPSFIFILIIIKKNLYVLK